MEKEKVCRAMARRDILLLALFAAALLLIVAYVAYAAVCAAPEYAAFVIPAVIAALCVLCGLLLQIGRFLKKRAAMVYENENTAPEDGKELPHA